MKIGNRNFVIVCVQFGRSHALYALFYHLLHAEERRMKLVARNRPNRTQLLNNVNFSPQNAMMICLAKVLASTRTLVTLAWPF